MLTIGLGPASASGGGGSGKKTIFDVGIPITKAVTINVDDKTITDFPECDTSMVTNMSYMFSQCTMLQKIALIDTSNVSNMASMFENCSSLQSIPLLNTSQNRNMSGMFKRCIALKEIPKLNTSQVTDMTSAFEGCSILENIPELDISLVSKTTGTFRNCRKIKECYLKGLCTTISIDYTAELSKESVLYLFNNAQTVSSKSITLHADVFAQLTEDEIAIATEKGFSVVSG